MLAFACARVVTGLTLVSLVTSMMYCPKTSACGQIAGCATVENCTTSTNQQCAKCNTGFRLVQGIKDSCEKIPTPVKDPKVYSGTYVQTYSNGHKDSTTVACDGAMTWRANKLTGKLYPAGSKLPSDRAAQNNDPNYQAKDGWYFRAWDRPKAWEFVKFENGNMIVHHFCTDSKVCNKKSPQGSAKYCCGSSSTRVPMYCGTFRLA